MLDYSANKWMHSAKAANGDVGVKSTKINSGNNNLKETTASPWLFSHNGCYERAPVPLGQLSVYHRLVPCWL